MHSAREARVLLQETRNKNSPSGRLRISNFYSCVVLNFKTYLLFRDNYEEINIILSF